MSAPRAWQGVHWAKSARLRVVSGMRNQAFQKGWPSCQISSMPNVYRIGLWTQAYLAWWLADLCALVLQKSIVMYLDIAILLIRKRKFSSCTYNFSFLLFLMTFGSFLLYFPPYSCRNKHTRKGGRCSHRLSHVLLTCVVCCNSCDMVVEVVA